MKKFVAVFLCLILILSVTACSPTTPKNGQTLTDEQLKKATQEYSDTFKSTANIKYNNIEIKAEIERLPNGSTTVTFLSPDTVKDMSFTVAEDDIKVNYMGMEFHIDPNNLDSSMVVSMMIGVFNNIASGQGITAKVEDNAIVLNGNNDNMQFEMTLDKQNGTALTLNIPSMGLSAEFE